MRRALLLWAATVAVIYCFAQSDAQIFGSFPPGTFQAREPFDPASATYTGPCDVNTSCVLAVSTRAYKSSYIGSASYHDATASATRSIATNGFTTGDVNGNSVNIANDQTGGNNATQSTGADQPTVSTSSGPFTTSAVNWQFADGGFQVWTGMTASLAAQAQTTTCAWVNPANLTSTLAIWGGDGGSTLGFRMNTSGNLELVNQFVALIATSSGTISAGSWSRVCFTLVASTGAWAFYIGGSASGSGTAGAVTLSAASNTLIGGDAGDKTWFGGMDDIIVWNTALGSTAIANDFNNTSK